MTIWPWPMLLLAAHGPRAVAAAFVKIYRAQLPAPEDIRKPSAAAARSPRGAAAAANDKPDQGERPRRTEHQAMNRPAQAASATGEYATVPGSCLNVGRERNADPKWLLPEICRQGEITKKDIGAIRVFDTETRFQVSARVAENFAALVAARQKGGVRIFPAPGNHGEPSPPRTNASEPTRPFAAKARPGDALPRKKPKWGKKKPR